MNQSETNPEESPKKNNLSYATRDETLVFNKNESKEMQHQKSLQIISSKELYYQNIPMPKEKANWNMSVSTLRHVSHSHQFSRSNRFPQNKCNYADSQKIQSPSTLGKRSASFGVGNRVKVPEALGEKKFRETVNCPFYQADINSINRCSSASNLNIGKGKSFGLGWKSYQASRAPHRSSVHSSYQVKQNPAPNRYEIDLRDKSPYNKISIYPRLQMFTTRNGSYKRGEPNPQSYDIKQSLVKPGKMNKGFGLGIRSDFTKYIKNNPGPVYNISGFCDKFTHLKVKLHQI